MSYSPHIQNLDTSLYKLYLNFNWISAWRAGNKGTPTGRGDVIRGVNFHIVCAQSTIGSYGLIFTQNLLYNSV